MSKQSTRKTPLWERCGDTTPRDWLNSKRMLWSLLAWAVSFAGLSQLIKRDLLPAGPIPWLLTAVPVIAGVLVILAYGRYLSEADELQRTIHLQALALGFGGAFFAASGYELLERLGAPKLDFSDLTLVMVFFYGLGFFLGRRRYR